MAKGLLLLQESSKNEIESLFAPLGMLARSPEEKFDAITSLTGSGPAFVFALVSGMIDAGIAMGFTKEEASAFVLQMIDGSMHLLRESKKDPLSLIKEIASPNGTTMEGLKVLEKQKVQETLLQTFLAAKKRSEELSREES